MSGTLYLLPCPIAEGPIEAALPNAVLAVARGLEYFLVEDAKTARAFLKHAGHPKPIRELSITEIGHAPRAEDIDGWIAPLLAGHDVAIVSEAGCPGIADPGTSIVAAAHERRIPVRPLVGPSSILLAVMASGLEGQRFRFLGYLPVAAEARAEALKTIERESKSRRETQVFIETPYRSKAMFDAILASCAGSTRLAVAADLMGADEFVSMRTVTQWKSVAAGDRPAMQRQPAVFCLLA